MSTIVDFIDVLFELPRVLVEHVLLLLGTDWQSVNAFFYSSALGSSTTWGSALTTSLICLLVVIIVRRCFSDPAAPNAEEQEQLNKAAVALAQAQAKVRAQSPRLLD
jgi:hypothetical protein